MKIIIAGAGEVGVHLAKLLSGQSQDIILIDTDKKRLKYAEQHTDVLVYRGNAASMQVLLDAKADSSDLLIAATESESTNFMVSILAKRLGTKKCVARITNPELINNYDKLQLKELGLDAIISPEQLAAEEIAYLVRQSAFTDAFQFEKGILNLIGIHLGDDAPIVNKTIRQAADMNPHLNFITIALYRNGETIIPRADTLIKKGDDCYFIAQTEGIPRVLSLTGNESVEFKNVMILGGSRIGVKAAKMLCRDYKIKLIEKDKEKAFELADQLENVMVLNADGRDAEFLEEENIDQMGVFIAVTGDSETNIMSCLVAKSHGVKKTIALVENMEYLHLSRSIGIDVFLNKKLLAASTIFRYVRKGNVLSSTLIRGLNAEILEFEVKPGTPITRRTLRDMKFPKDAVIGGAIRKGKPMITMGDFQAQAFDKLIVFCLPGSIAEVERFFN
ncbi:MAG: Trk system potassium transporter TrkA [Flavobacteriales bacterium]|nr:Trk system potassium transporter TrkA [Flavobacteriales bacterium]